jgi:hypothetical protein
MNSTVCVVQLVTADSLCGGGDGDKEGAPVESKYVLPRILSQALVTLTAVPKADPRDAEAISKATFIPAHHPCIGRSSPVWSLELSFMVHCMLLLGLRLTKLASTIC